MPIYIYRCKNCGVQFEKHQSFSEQPLTRCPECSKKTLHKVFQPVGIVFKGSGFYATDNRSPSGASRGAGKDKESDSEGESKTSTTEKTSETKDSGAKASKDSPKD